MSISLLANVLYNWNQGSAAECYAFAAAGLYAMKCRQLGRPVFEPSRRFLTYNCLVADAQSAIHAGKTVKLQDQGSFIATAMKALHDTGICSEARWSGSHPFDAHPDYAANMEALGHRITGATTLTSKRDPKTGLYPLDDFKAILDGGNGFTVSFVLASDGHLHLDGASNLIGPPEPIVWNGQNNHAVMVVGHDDTRKAFQIHNSYSINGSWNFWISEHLMANPLFAFDAWSIDGLLD